jgi:hypothetical protein
MLANNLANNLANWRTGETVRQKPVLVDGGPAATLRPHIVAIGPWRVPRRSGTHHVSLELL